MAKPELSIIIPVFNEAGTLTKIVRRVGKINVDKEIIIVDDGSSDGSRQLLRKLKTASRLKKLYHKQNMGKGTAIRTALKKASGKFTVIQDADLEYYPKDLERLIGPLRAGKSNVVYGSRFKFAKKGIYSNYFYYLGGQMVNQFANILYGIDITDEPTCYKLVNTKLLKSLDLECTGFEFCPEVTAKLSLRNEKIIELPIRYKPRHFSEGKKINWIDGIKAMYTLMKYRFQNSRPDRDFMSQGLDALSSASNYNNWILDQFRPYIGESVLEVGAGIGTFTKMLLRRSKKIVAVEIDSKFLRKLKDTFRGNKNVQVKLIDFSAKKSRLKKVDSVLMINVLEHIEDDFGMIANTAAALKPGGHLLIFVPAIPELYSAWDESVGHYRRYTKGRLKKICKQSGLKVRKLEYFNMLGALGWYLNKLVSTTPKSSQFSNQVVIFDRYFVPTLKTFERYFKVPFGQSLVLVAQK